MKDFCVKETINRWGQTIPCKEIPEGGTPGRMDPRVLANYRASEPGPNVFSTSVALETQRAAMGWNNRDIAGDSVTKETYSYVGLNGEIPLLLYRPEGGEAQKRCLVFFHGGGFFGGSCRCVENICKLLAKAADAVVISVDYRLAPEYAYPAGLQDCFDAVSWAYTRGEALDIDKTRIGVAGDSAGGTYAAVLSLLDRDLGLHRIGAQLLFYPSVNLGGLPCDHMKWDVSEYDIDPEQELWIRQAIGLLAPGDLCIAPYYLGGRVELLKHPYASPLFAESMSGLPPALIVGAEFDYLRLEGEAYGRRLADAGVKTELLRYNGVDHAFLDKLGDYPQSEDCIYEAARFLRAVL